MHVAVPLARSGDSVTNVIRHLAREHRKAGGTTYAVLSENRDTTVPDAIPVEVDYMRTCPRGWFNKREMLVDHAMGQLGRPRPYTARLFQPAIEAAAAVQPDVTVVHNAHYSLSALPMWREALGDSRLVVYVHVSIARSYRARELRRLLAGVDAVVFVSDFMRKQLSAQMGPLPPAHVVLNGCPEISTSSGKRSGILFVGQVAPHKGPHLLVDAAAILAERGHFPEITIIGSSVHGQADELTDYEQRIRAKAESIPGARIQFLRWLPNDQLSAHYAQAAVVVAPSTWDDPCPLVVLEAFAAGAPVVTTRRGGIPEAGQDAPIYVDEDGRPIADAIEPLLRGDGLVEQMSSASYERARQLAWPRQYQAFRAAIS